MLPKARSRSARRRSWSLFGRRGNRRVRHSSPALPRPPRPPLWVSVWAALVAWRRSFLVAGVGMMLAAGAWAGRWYVTHARHFALTEVRVSPTAHINAEALIARANVPVGVNLFAIDRDDVARAVSQEPWVARAHVRRELPSTLMIDVVEREPACTVAFGALYLADGDGYVFKRATPEESAALPVVTGIGRDDYVGAARACARAAATGAARDRRVARIGRPPAARRSARRSRRRRHALHRSRRRRAARRRRRHAAGASCTLRRRRWRARRRRRRGSRRLCGQSCATRSRDRKTRVGFTVGAQWIERLARIMAKREELVVGLDIGTTKIAAVVGEVDRRRPRHHRRRHAPVDAG